jgi:phenylacetate-CoA ligase
MYQFFLENIIIPIGDLFNKSTFIKELKYWRKIDSYSSEELERIQVKNLKIILNFAIKNIPFYKKIELENNDPYSWLKKFPVLTKNHLRENNSALISVLENQSDLIKYSSSGSSGVQSSVYMSRKEQSIIRGILTHWWEWSSYRIGKPIVQTGISPERGMLKLIKDKLFKTIYINAFSHSEAQLKKLCKKLHMTSKYYFSGYASSLNVIAEYAIENNYNIHLKSVISFGDKLFPQYRKNIEKAFKCKVFDTYGSNEGLMIAAQKDLEYLYILSPHVYIEIVDDENNPVVDGEMGHILVTRLDGFSMPLIRYKLGDLGILLPKNKYPKEREFKYPLLQQIVGRETDIIRLPSGKKLIVHSFTGVFEYVPEIKQFKVIQENLKGITIQYIKSKGFTKEILENVTFELQKHIIESTFNILYEEVDIIKPTKSGKPQIIESHL